MAGWQIEKWAPLIGQDFYEPCASEGDFIGGQVVEVDDEVIAAWFHAYQAFQLASDRLKEHYDRGLAMNSKWSTSGPLLSTEERKYPQTSGVGEDASNG